MRKLLGDLFRMKNLGYNDFTYYKINTSRYKRIAVPRQGLDDHSLEQKQRISWNTQKEWWHLGMSFDPSRILMPDKKILGV